MTFASGIFENTVTGDEFVVEEAAFGVYIRSLVSGICRIVCTFPVENGVRVRDLVDRKGVLTSVGVFTHKALLKVGVEIDEDMFVEDLDIEL